MFAFIGGTPAAGKSYLARKFIEKSKLKIEYIEMDTLREKFARDPALDYWVKFLESKDELKYWNKVTAKEHLDNMIAQSEAFWPEIVKKVKSIQRNNEHAIFEAVNILPHLAYKDFDFPGLFLVQDDVNELRKRLETNPRWGESKELIELEAKFFTEWEGEYIKREAKEYKYPVFDESEDAEKYLEQIFEKAY